NLRVISESRIMANFSGSFNNMTTLAHELGHGYHGECLRGQTLLNSRYTMPIAETASIFCETIVTDAAFNQADDQAKLAILEHQISSAAQVIVDIYSRFLFETELIQRREEGSLSVEQLKEAMKNAQMRAYGDGLDPEVLHPYMWVNKPHYYNAENNFYNFPYSFGLLFGKGLYAEYLEKGAAFVDSYRQLLAETGRNTVAEIGKIAGIDVNQTAFWKKSLRMIEDKIEQFTRIA
ncbi:MAG TPA: M3 family metallopeptidase, partial [Thermotogota bacterium]|nr:M3 family metallopeptidase [Thermotogota bacterium]